MANFNTRLVFPNGYVVEMDIPEGMNRPNAMVCYGNPDVDDRAYVYKFNMVVDTDDLDIEDLEL